MANIVHLPVELTLRIIEYLKPPTLSADTHDTLMRQNKIIRDLNLKPNIFEADKPPEQYHRAAAAAFEERHRARLELERSAYADLRSVRQVNSYFNQLSVPLIYAELNILPEQAAMNIASTVLSRYGDHVRYLHLMVTKERISHPRSEEYNRLMVMALVACRRATSLALYYESKLQPEEETTAYRDLMAELSSKVMFRVTQGSLSSLALGSLIVLQRGYELFRGMPLELHSLLDSISLSLNQTPTLKHLEISCGSITLETYNNLRSRAIHLHSLTLVSCINSKLPKLWSFEGVSEWTCNAKLTHLRLIRCQSAYAPHIPELVRNFPALRHLLVSTCGSFSDVISPNRQLGWSREPDALWRHRMPLDTFFIEHMIKWEILAMGTIPAKTVIATSIRSGDLEASFLQDPEIFPCLTLLSIEEKPVGRGDAGPMGPDVEWRERVLASRGIELKADARWLITRR